jgi:hypothetical protein
MFTLPAARHATSTISAMGPRRRVVLPLRAMPHERKPLNALSAADRFADSRSARSA